MKKFIPIVLLTLILSQFTNAQSACSQYYVLQEGVTYEYTNYNKKGKEEGKMTYSVTDVDINGNIASATMNMELTDKKNNVYTSAYDIKCEGNMVKIDFKSLMNEQMMSQFGDVEVDLSGTDIELPNNLSVGQELADANIEMKMKMGGMNMNMNVETVNRKVEAKETVSTPAGKYECFVIYSETKSKMMMAKQTYPSRVWLAEGVGMVKQETFNKNGKLMGSMILTAFNK